MREHFINVGFIYVLDVRGRRRRVRGEEKRERD
jgi:hypothetical protein